MIINKLNTNLINDIRRYNSDNDRRVEISGDVLKIHFKERICEKISTESVLDIQRYLSELKEEIELIEAFLVDIEKNNMTE